MVRRNHRSQVISDAGMLKMCQVKHQAGVVMCKMEKIFGQRWIVGSKMKLRSEAMILPDLNGNCTFVLLGLFSYWAVTIGTLTRPYNKTMLVLTRQFLVVQQIPLSHLSQVYHPYLSHWGVQPHGPHHLNRMRQGSLLGQMSLVTAVLQMKGFLQLQPLVMMVFLSSWHWVLTVFLDFQVYNNTEYIYPIVNRIIEPLLELFWVNGFCVVDVMLLCIVYS